MTIIGSYMTMNQNSHDLHFVLCRIYVVLPRPCFAFENVGPICSAMFCRSNGFSNDLAWNLVWLKLVRFWLIFGSSPTWVWWVSWHVLDEFGDADCRRKFRSQTSDNMDRWKAEQGRGREKRKIRREKIRRERVRRKKMQMREKVGKSRNTVFFQWFVAPEGRKVGSLKRRVRSQLATGAMKNCTPLWREAHFEVKSVKNWRSRTTFGSWDVEKVHAVVARSTFPSQNVQNTSASDHFWKLRCRKSARRCGAKHISKSKCTKHLSFGPLLEVAMSKKCTPLWHEAHFQVKMCKTPQLRTTFGSWDVEKAHAVVARSTFPSQNAQSTPFSDHFWRFRCRKSVEKVHAVVARSTFRSQKCKKLRVLSLFWREDVEKVDTD